MLKLFAPDKYISGYAKVNPDELKKRGIRVLVCDIDNTLVAHDEADPSEEVKAFLQRVKDSGLEIILISNNVEERASFSCAVLSIREKAAEDDISENDA